MEEMSLSEYRRYIKTLGDGRKKDSRNKPAARTVKAGAIPLVHLIIYDELGKKDSEHHIPANQTEIINFYKNLKAIEQC